MGGIPVLLHSLVQTRLLLDLCFTRLSMFFPQPHERKCVWPVGIVRHEIKHRERASSRPSLSTHPNNESSSCWEFCVLRSCTSLICGDMSVMCCLDQSACDFWRAKTGCIDLTCLHTFLHCFLFLRVVGSVLLLPFCLPLCIHVCLCLCVFLCKRDFHQD